MPAQFVLHISKDGQFYFHLTAANNETILSSEMYKAKSGALNGIESVKKNSAMDARFSRLESKGKFYFVLKAANNEVIGTSEMYNSQQSRDDGIKAVMKVGPAAPLKEKLE